MARGGLTTNITGPTAGRRLGPSPAKPGGVDGLVRQLGIYIQIKINHLIEKGGQDCKAQSLNTVFFVFE